MTSPIALPVISLGVLLAAGLLLAAGPGNAQSNLSTTATGATAASQNAGGPAWTTLGTSEQRILLPLMAIWPTIDPQRKQKWREVAASFNALSVEQQERLRSRMVEWASMTPAQRNAARVTYEVMKKVPAAERQARWEAYQNLSDEQRRALVAQASQRPTRAASAPVAAAVRKTPSVDDVQPKSNIVNPANTLPDRPKPVALGTVQAGVGVSTRPITQPPSTPRHQQPGLPKIAATPEFINSETLLPRRGPQGVSSGPGRADAP